MFRWFFLEIILVSLSFINADAKSCTLGKLESFEAPESDELCKRQFGYFVESLRNDVNWATDMFSSFANFDKTYSCGNSYDFGDFDRCLEVHLESGDENVGVVKGKHCMVQYYPVKRTVKEIPPTQSNYNKKWKHLSRRFGGAVCVPSSCSSVQVQALMDHILNGTGLTVSRDYNQDDYCQTSERQFNRNFDYIMRSTILLFVALLVFSSAYDLFRRSWQGCELDPRLDSLLISFSLYTNVKELFNFSRSANAIGFLSGIKALSYFGIIFLHSISSRLLFPLRNPREAENFLNSPLNSFAIGLYFCVDSFLLISGYLMTKSIFKELDRKSFSLWKTYFRRYMRITPVVIASMLHIAGFWNYLPPKDPYNFYKDHQEMCSKYWWAKLLHVQNYVNVRELCNHVTWYLSMDFQLVILSPFVIYPLWRWKQSAFVLLPVLVAILQCFVYQEVLRIEDFLKSFTFASPLQGEYAELYHQTHFRATPWIIGIMLGCFMTRQKALQINKSWILLMWMFAALIFMQILFPQVFGFTEFMPIVYANARLLWAIAMSWIIIACSYGHGGVLNEFLSLKIWMLIEKIGLSLYIIHTSCMVLYVQKRRAPVDFETDTIFYNFTADLVNSLIGACIYYLVVERPFILIGNWFCNSLKLVFIKKSE